MKARDGTFGSAQVDRLAIRSLEGLAGATIDSQQAAALAEHFAAQLGLRIEDR